MKHLLTWLMLFAFAIILHAQQPVINSKDLFTFQKYKQTRNIDLENTQDYGFIKSQLKDIPWKYNTFIAYDTLGNLKEYLTSTFDKNNNILVLTKKKWQQDIWTFNYITTLSYDSYGNLLSGFYEEYKNNKWQRQLDSFTYDNNQNLLSEQQESFENNTWKKQKRITYTYNENNKILYIIWWYWSDNIWKRDFNEIYSYDSIGNLVEKYRQVLLNSTLYDSRYIYTYDTIGNLITENYEFFNYNKWEKYFYNEYIYDLQGNTYSILKEYWNDNVCNHWEKHFYTYDTKKNKISDTCKWWLPSDSGKYLTTYTYNINNNVLSEFKWHLDNNSWINDYKTSYSYDSLGNSFNGKFEKYINNKWVPGEYPQYVYVAGEMSEFFNFCYRYEATQTPIQQNIHNILIYPNPSKGMFYIEINEPFVNPFNLKIINALNQIIYQAEVSDNKILINLPNLAPGMYFIHLTLNGKAYLKKIIIQKNS
jgi:hypothetical protein